jgi:hypothetical protein
MKRNRKRPTRGIMSEMEDYAVAAMLVLSIAGIGVLHFAFIFTWIGGR